MPIARRFLVALIAVVAFLLSGMPTSFGASTPKPFAATLRITPVSLPSPGGTVIAKLTVSGAKSCKFEVNPAIAKFATTISCTKQTITRTVRITPNTSHLSRQYIVKATVTNGKKTLVRVARLVVAASHASNTNTTSCPPGFTQVGPGACAK